MSLFKLVLKAVSMPRYRLVLGAVAVVGLTLLMLPLRGSADVGAGAVGLTRAVAENAGWSARVQIAFEGDSFVFRGDGLPDHELLDYYQAVSIVDFETTYVVAPTPQTLRIEIPLAPKKAAKPTSTDIGVIGVTISGGLLYSPWEADRSTVALEDNFVIDGIPFIDACNGHTGPFGWQYHYHGIPYCVTTVIDQPGAHSRLLGYLFDGYPVYGPQDAGGVEITPADLDGCNGHFGPTPEFPEGFYHYHTTAKFPYVMPCYTGEVDLWPRPIRPLIQGVDLWPVDTLGFWLLLSLAGTVVVVGGRRVWQVKQVKQVAQSEVG